MGAVWRLGGVGVVGVAPPATPGAIVAEAPPAETPPVAARAAAGKATAIRLQKSVEHRARKRTATSFVGLRG